MTTPSYSYKANNETDTENLAGWLGDFFMPGSLLALDGDLGAGKTRFSQGLARAAGVQGVVNSPTFTIIKEYEGARLPVYHMDVYRISLEEADDLGLDEYFYGQGLTILEWASLIEELLPPDRLDIYIENAGGNQRVFRLTPRGEPYETWCRELKEKGIL
ncbi:tRNA (adenosine(37)-N6)-threonylcarbamoyltransferase complex ATPase subunit type 1 TsaE [Paenibacillus larvae]|uniref:tRNA threonylcarbamoyladenosine biosynthesis protein TsaE n=4 Tax=Paenibacillus larvae TaxID=1464 RepID=V9W276_9BACL|nr:tRNA (adenosine(37)-N6)-threonylcarbamoyltransferase complex ATPase subunit type 1 TsaE [Paenibacillus larvae]AHD04208.1 ATP-binding protein YdiB [Paenibacillus larvae subsp. larvae DSM 25430]AQR78998.1 tRNA (adenosine(37)-N6)-threonylcarbamoyltransferase complex ATPase subunit type 1 TsaE [Paenibacillus larvae subsp. larvae]AQT85325.1 tRNA (adenosine(37)-N6)-threonylcarbamoyltransferase complex ATPase subunit type 1 TsaE [Paenibacillus larvae subsp. pulvifaciens]AQZ47328.1 tRNA (adenosine(3